MIFIIRTEAGRVPPLDIKMIRQTPAIVPDSLGRIDYFCLGDPEAAKAAGWPVVSVHDGWYADDSTGGMALWGQGAFWEVRDTPFSIKEACRPSPPSGRRNDDGEVNVRDAIFRG
jgi:hypothetical protein